MTKLPPAPIAGLTFGPPVETARAALQEFAFTGLVADADAAAACRAGLWLAFDFFEESHAISQDLDTPEGSFWHGILHRREGDAANAAYWFRRVGRHPVLAELEREVATLGFQPSDRSGYAFGFIEACTRTGNSTEQMELLKWIQYREWQLLYDHCHDLARGT